MLHMRTDLCVYHRRDTAAGTVSGLIGNCTKSSATARGQTSHHGLLELGRLKHQVLTAAGFIQQTAPECFSSCKGHRLHANRLVTRSVNQASCQHCIGGRAPGPDSASYSSDKA